MNRLWVRLTLAFALVTVVGILAAAWLADRQVSASFGRYVARTQVADPDLLTELGDFYTRTGEWSGVDALLGAGRGPGVGPGAGAGRGMGRGGPPLALADADGRIVYDRFGRQGTALERGDLADAVPISAQNRTVGYLLAMPGGWVANNVPAQTFLEQVNRALLQAGLVAGVLGTLLGLIIARGVAAPLNRLAKAARRISRGEFGQRVPVEGAAEIAALAQAFNGMAADLEQAEGLRRNMVADIAHELRTPLSVIQGNLQAILDGVYPLEKSEIAAVYDETLVLNRLVSDLRELAQAEAGQLSLELGPTDLAPLLDAEAALFAEAVRRQAVRLDVAVAPRLSPVLADAHRVRQVIHNLVANAMRYTPPGGRITLAAGPATTGFAHISVSDTGAGIRPEDLPHVFDRFWRADRSRAREQGGSGLGLAIARQLVKAQGGDIGVESAPGAGSTFWFTLPIADAKETRSRDDPGSKIG
ncbi:MAG: ATP-binding protein [Anaerolineae bacterium]